ncbi:hypothetical protein ACQP2F_28075 [Actinoplanes sp. CA-030573]|uniref:hypothetical protein n=1 Tax=Actinoplanes sp. CA-030573 TaxID=3239898 RepID=UPI003D8E334A
MSEMTSRKTAAVAAVLRDLLANNPRYRRQWLRHAERDRGGINGAAVAKVIEGYLVDAGEISEWAGSHRQGKDRVSRALNGDRFSPATIRLFAAAFRMAPADVARLDEAFATSPARGVSGTLRTRRELVRPQDHRTMNIVERYCVGADGRLVGRRTQQTIRATANDVGIYMFNHEPSATGVEVLHGGRVGRRYRYGGGLAAVEILLDNPLARDQATAFEYRTDYADGHEVSEVRRSAFLRTEHVDFAVEFAPDRIPRAAWWCAWDDQLGGRIVFQEPVPIGPAIRNFVPFVEQSVVGFRWMW